MATHERSAGAATGLPWPVLPAFVPFLSLWIAWSWWAEARTQLAALAVHVPLPDPGAMAGVVVVGRALAVLSEVACYVLWWKSRHLRLPYWRFVCWVAALSTADLLGFALGRAAAGAPEILRMVAMALAGPMALDPSAAAAAGHSAAFGNLGLLTLTRVGMTAWAQARGIGRGVGGPLILTAAAWLLTRLVGWWSVDLLKGLSPVP